MLTGPGESRLRPTREGGLVNKEVKVMTFYDYFYRRPIVTFLMLLTSGLAFGLLTVNIFRLFAANWNFIATYGLIALHEGALVQTFELLLTGVVSMMFFVIFRFSEEILIDWIRARRFPRKRKSGNDSDGETNGASD